MCFGPAGIIALGLSSNRFRIDLIWHLALEDIGVLGLELLLGSNRLFQALDL